MTKEFIDPNTSGCLYKKLKNTALFLGTEQ